MTTYQPSSDATIDRWLTRYMKIRQSELARKSLNIHRRTGHLLRKFFGPSTLCSDITRSRATDWRLWLASEVGLTESTVCKHCRTAKVIFSRGVDEELLDSNPFSRLKVTPPSRDIFSRRVISEKEVLAIIACSDEITPMVALCYYAGLRTTEALHLLKADIAGLDRIYVRPREGTITTKQRYREVRIEPELPEHLGEDVWFSYNEAWVVNDPSDSDGTVCGILEAGRHNLIHRTLRDACTEAGVEPFTFQQLRQTRDSIWHKKFPSYVACAWLGHSETVARQHYLTIDESLYSSTTTKGELV